MATSDWIEWKGGECPTDPDVWVEVRFRDGHVTSDRGFWWSWPHDPEQPQDDIIAYRVVSA